MSLKILPIDGEDKNYEFKCDFDGVIYTLNVRYNSRMDRWILDIKTVDDEYILMGIPLLIGTDFIARFKDSRLPHGQLFIVNIPDQYTDAGEDELGTDALVFYNEAI